MLFFCVPSVPLLAVCLADSLPSFTEHNEHSQASSRTSKSAKSLNTVGASSFCFSSVCGILGTAGIGQQFQGC